MSVFVPTEAVLGCDVCESNFNSINVRTPFIVMGSLADCLEGYTREGGGARQCLLVIVAGRGLMRVCAHWLTICESVR